MLLPCHAHFDANCCLWYTVQQVRKRGSNTVTALRRLLVTAAQPLVDSHTYLPRYLGTEKRLPKANSDDR